MPHKNLALARIVAQGLASPEGDPLGVVGAFGMMQGQDISVFSSVALRTAAGDIGPVFDALRGHELVRAYPMRGTVFLARARDMRWMTELCSATTAKASRKRALTHYGLGDKELAAVRDAVLSDPRTDSAALTRAEFRDIVREALPGHDHDEQGIYYRSLFTMLVEHDVVYSGWDGKEQRIFAAHSILGPGIADLFGDTLAATTELLARYLRTRGPATLGDFSWWSKLSFASIRRAAEALPDDVGPLDSAAKKELGLGEEEEFYAREGIVEDVIEQRDLAARPLLLPAFDELILGYQDRLFVMTPDVHAKLVPGNMGVFRKSALVAGTVRGSWSMTTTKSGARLQVEPYGVVPKKAEPGLRRAFASFPHLRNPGAGNTR